MLWAPRLHTDRVLLFEQPTLLLSQNEFNSADLIRLTPNCFFFFVCADEELADAVGAEITLAKFCSSSNQHCYRHKTNSAPLIRSVFLSVCADEELTDAVGAEIATNGSSSGELGPSAPAPREIPDGEGGVVFAPSPPGAAGQVRDP